jgi:hypothetical protein
MPDASSQSLLFRPELNTMISLQVQWIGSIFRQKFKTKLFGIMMNWEVPSIGLTWSSTMAGFLFGMVNP